MENVREVHAQHLASLIRAKTDQVLVIDSRTFCEYNTSHVISSVNVWSSKIRKKRLQQNSMSVQDYLSSACEVRRSVDLSLQWGEIIVYDQSAPGISSVPQDSFLYVLLDKLSSVYKNVRLLIGGFLEFQSLFPDCCEDATQKCSPLTSLSQPCLPVANVGPTRILPFLYLGSQHDANNKQMLQDHCILYELNVSISCPKPDFVQDSHFFRIPVNDNFSEKLLPYFWDAFNFIDKVRESGGSVLVHCLAGISRSATIAIAYVMKHLHLPYDEAYRYVKNRRPTISPNINFVGQLLELDRLLRRDGTLCDPCSAPASFRQTSPSIQQPSSLEFAVNNKVESLTSSFSTSSYSTDSSSALCDSSSHNVMETGKPPSVADAFLSKYGFSAAKKPFSKGLYSKAANISTNFASKEISIREPARAGGTIPRSLSLNLKSTLEAVPASPDSAPQSPETVEVKTVPNPRQDSCDLSSSSPDSPFQTSLLSPPSSPHSPLNSKSGYKISCGSPSSRSCSMKSLISPGNYSPTIIEVRKSPTIMENVFERQYCSVLNDEPVLNEEGKPKNYYSSTATISVDDEFSKHPRSVCIIEVNTEAPVTYVDNSNSEPMIIRETERPMIIRETEVYASPSNQPLQAARIVIDDNSNNNNVNADNNFNRNSINHLSVENRNLLNRNFLKSDSCTNNNNKAVAEHKTLVPIRGSASLGNILDRPKVLELCTPIYNVKRSPLPVLLGDTSWNTKGSDFESGEPLNYNDGVLNSKNSPLISVPSNVEFPSNPKDELPLEANCEETSIGDFSDNVSEFSVMQSDSGVSIQTDCGDSGIQLPHPIPRCYSSSETHLNTRRLLENIAAADYSTRKSCSNDEVAKDFAFLHKSGGGEIQAPPTPREATNNNFGNWNPHGELVRCDSWSTSGLGSEISDWESLQEDSYSTHCDDPMGPFDAVFSDVFPGGGKSDSDTYLQVFPRLLKDTEENLNEMSEVKASALKPRHNSFKDQRWRHPHKQIPLSRPASLPGVMGTYLATGSQPKPEQETNSPVELRSSASQGRVGLKRASVSSRDSGFGGSLRDSNASMGNRPSDSSGSTGTVIPSEGGRGIRRNDSGYYSVPDQSPSASRGRGKDSFSEDSKQYPGKSLVSYLKTRKTPAKPQSLAITPFSLKPPASGHPLKNPPVSPSPKPSSPTKSKSSPSRQSPTKLPSPQRSMGSDLPKQTSPLRSLPKNVCGSPQPRIFGASTFYLPHQQEAAKESRTVNINMSSRKPLTAFSSSKSSTQSTLKEETSNKSSCSKTKISPPSGSSYKSSSSYSLEKSKACGSSSKSGLGSNYAKSCSPSRTDLQFGKKKSKSPSPLHSPSGENSDSSSESTFRQKSLSSSRESSIESDNSVVKFVSEAVLPEDCSKTGHDLEDSDRKFPEKRKSRSGSTEECGKEKRRSCDLDLTEEQCKKSVSIKTGVRLAQELLQSMESIVSAELSEIRRCTAELSSRYRLKSRLRDDMLPSSTQLKQMSQFYVMPSPTPHPAPDTERCRSEPPFGGDGLYRAQSCPGLPRPLQTEKVPELRCSSHMPRLRSERTPPTREKLLNRYSCGALDTQKRPVLVSPNIHEGPFESCPDLGTLRARSCTSDSSSSSMSSSRSSFSRLLPVS